MADISNAERYRQERQQQVQDRRINIIDAAERLFLDKGLANTTMIEIAQKARISKVSLYRYFSSRDPIAFEVAIRMLKKIAATANDKIPKHVTGIEAIRMGYLNMIREFDTLRDAYRYISMFDHLYAKTYPSDELAQWYKQGIFGLFGWQHSAFDTSKLDVQVREQLVTLGNAVMSFLEKMAARGELMGVEQGVPLCKQIRHFELIIDHCLDHIFAREKSNTDPRYRDSSRAPA